MDEFPANSKIVKPARKAAPEEKRVEQVTVGEVIVQKQSLRKRFLETFVGGDTKGVGTYVLMDVLIPAAKDAIADAMSQGIEKMLFGEARSTSRRPRNVAQQSYVAYNRYGSAVAGGGGRRDESTRPPMGRRARATHNFSEIILATRGEADEVIDRLFDLVSKYESASVADLYELVGITPEFTDDKWGWTSDGGLVGARVERVRNGYLLDLPRPEPLD